MANSGQVYVLDPRVLPDIPDSMLAERPESLDGSTVGLLANGKRNSEELLVQVYEVLSESFKLKRAVPDNKGNASRPCPPNLLAELSEVCDVVITASGD